MRTINVGNFDAAITIFNAVGHLTKAGFSKTMRNIHRNLNDEGIYIFDILNLNYVLDKDNIMKMTDGLFHKIFDAIAKEYPHIENEHWIVDIGAAEDMGGQCAVGIEAAVFFLQNHPWQTETEHAFALLLVDVARHPEKIPPALEFHQQLHLVGMAGQGLRQQTRGPVPFDQLVDLDIDRIFLDVGGQHLAIAIDDIRPALGWLEQLDPDLGLRFVDTPAIKHQLAGNGAEDKHERKDHPGEMPPGPRGADFIQAGLGFLMQ